METLHSDILIIGAGMAGLACAARLKAERRDLRVLDKGRGPGGRMAARRVKIGGEDVSFDHGAQFFTARDPGFQAAVAGWEARGAAARWVAAEAQGSDTAWVGTPGMNGPIRAMSQGLEVHWSTRALSLTRVKARWHVGDGERTFTANTVLVAVPAEQASELLAEPAPGLATIPAGVVSEPCWAVMAAFVKPLAIEQDAVRDPDAPIAWAARNSAKPSRTGKECWVLHASPARSRELLNLPKEEVASLLLNDFADHNGIEPVTPIHVAAHRWLYAMPKPVPSSASGEPARFDAAAQIGIAGDYLHSPRVEGAWISGTALAKAVIGQ